MSLMITNSIHYENIAEAIRNKNGTNTQYKPSEMAGAINEIEIKPDLVQKTWNGELALFNNGYTIDTGLTSIEYFVLIPKLTFNYGYFLYHYIYTTFGEQIQVGNTIYTSSPISIDGGSVVIPKNTYNHDNSGFSGSVPYVWLAIGTE